MAEYIESTKMADVIHRYFVGYKVEDMIRDIRKEAIADVAPVVHGRFELKSVSDVTSTFVCSECSREFEIANHCFRKPTKYPSKNYPYCNCGARMDGE